jgi:beta-lactamase superfamily II metal-dependent hydrolase
MKIKILQAFNGDSILITLQDEEGKNRNILIDGGTPNTYEYKDRLTGKIKAGDLQLIVQNLKQNNEKIDLLILTHIDEDHIGGILRLFEEDPNAPNSIGKIWFNSGRLISEYFKEEEIKENLLKLQILKSTDTSIRQGVIFEDFIDKHNLWDRKIIKDKEEFNEFGISFKILSPSIDTLKSLLKKWEKERPDTLTSKSNDHSATLKELIEKDTFEEDNSIANGSSIAFIFTLNSKSILFLGDAHPTTIINSLNHLGYSEEKPLKIEFVKVSHHGSKANTNFELLNLIDCNNFIISSNGDVHNLPDKQCLARIIKSKPGAVLYFNYPEKIDEIFSEQDFKDLKFTALSGNEDITI